MHFKQIPSQKSTYKVYDLWVPSSSNRAITRSGRWGAELGVFTPSSGLTEVDVRAHAARVFKFVPNGEDGRRSSAQKVLSKIEL